MRRIQATRWAGFLALAVLIPGILWWLSTDRRPNILLITLDTTRADRLGCYGYLPASTPNLDAVAQRGVLFERAYAPAPMTSPSHASMFTGLWPPEHGVFTNGQVTVDDSLSTVAEVLSEQGYDTAAFVAAFVLQEKFGFQQGFNVFDDDLSKAAADIDVLHQYRDGRYVIDSAVNWLERRERKEDQSPFFCWVHLYDAHDPYLDHPEEFGDKFSERKYDGELSYVDLQVGKLLQKLELSGLSKNTVIVVVGDHGESLGEHGEETHGYMLHDSTLRVPLIISNPNAAGVARRIESPVTIVSLFPTLLEMGGIKPPSAQATQSLASAFNNSEIPPQFCYSQTDEPYLQAFWSPLRGVTNERWRYVRSTKPELYDLQADPKELNNLAENQPDTVLELDGELAAFEGGLQRRVGGQVSLSNLEERALHSLGYAGGSVSMQESSLADKVLPDIKDMIGFLNRLQEATHLIDHHEIESAIKILEPLAVEVPSFMRVHLNLALCYLQQEEFQKAAHSCSLALEIDPNSDRALDMAGFSYLKLQQLDKASQHFQRLLSLNPESENGHLFLGEIYQRQMRYDLAMRHYGEVLRINPANSMARAAYTAIQQAEPNR